MCPHDLEKLNDSDLLRAGLSSRKISFLRDLAARVYSKALDFNLLDSMPDEEVIARLTSVKGIGRWSAEMYLIFSMNRLNVFPIDDVALRNAITRLYGVKDDDSESALINIADSWQPFRSIACWYLYSLANKQR